MNAKGNATSLRNPDPSTGDTSPFTLPRPAPTPIPVAPKPAAVGGPLSEDVKDDEARCGDGDANVMDAEAARVED